MKWPRGLYYDNEATNPNKLYVCDYLNQRIAVYNDKDQFRDEIVLNNADRLVPNFNTKSPSFDSADLEDEVRFCPLSLKITADHIYVTDDWSSSNCIRVFDKNTKELIRNIGDLQAWNPMGVYIDHSGNLFTLARLYYETGTTFLFCFDKDGKLLYRTNLNISDNCVVSSFVIDEYTNRSNYGMIASGETKIYYIRF